MNAIKEKCRPKHQVLVLKCYPRTSKGAVDVKPNSSELSYLLFYATSRRSKIQKIGAFLEKKTASDVWRMRIGNVQVTLGILAALVEKAPKDIALIAPCVLKILDLILGSNDITMTESSLLTFEAFCEHHEASSLFADQAYVHQYESIIRSYARLASTPHAPAKGAPLSRPVQARWRTVGLEAIRHVASSEALASPAGRQIDLIVPVILENLSTYSEEALDMLVQRGQKEEKVDVDRPMRRRTSVATVGTVDTAGDTNPVALSGTAFDVDKMAEEEIGVLAMQCLKSIFVAPNRTQIYAATAALLKFISEKVKEGRSMAKRVPGTYRDSGWAVRIFGIIARWAPVQDRYIILVVTLDTMMRTPMKAEDKSLEQHIVMTAMIGSLLQSDVNLIGLSVMDVLLGLVKQMRKLFQLPSSRNGDDGVREAESDVEKGHQEPSSRKELLDRIEQCTGDLAHHIYYADQISDMIAAILVRLRPNRSSSTTSTPQVENGDGTTNGGPMSSVADLAEGQSQADAYFSYNMGRISALRVIKLILLVANAKTKTSANMNLSRSRVPVHVWEGTQWLLRDPDGLVRQAYVDTLVTWLNQETTRADSQASGDPGRTSIKNSRDLSEARRAVSNASNRERQPRGRRSQFVALLHLAIYDSALQFVDFDNDMVLLHCLLTNLVFKLGVNSTRYGIPMIYRLQEDIQELEQPIHKVRVAGLCHGYFWALSEKFDFEASVVGRAIHNEIVRRRSKGFWIESICIPLPSIHQFGRPGQQRPHPGWDFEALETGELLPFDDRTSLVECISTGYEECTLSPPASPTVSPGRTLSNAMMGSNMNSMPAIEKFSELPSNFREEMLTDWSRDTVIAALSSESKSESLNGSRTGTTGTNRNRLTINTAGLNGASHLPISPYGSNHNLRPHSAQVHGDRDRLGSMSKLRKSSVRSGISRSPSMSSKAGVASVEQLKMVLSGNVSPKMGGLTSVDDDSDESMVSYDYSPSEGSFSPMTQAEPATTTGEALRRTISASRQGPLSSNPTSEGKRDMHGADDDDDDDDDEIPPVPPLPNLSSFTGIGSSWVASDTAAQDHTARKSTRASSRHGGESVNDKSPRAREESGRSVDLQELLRGIDSRSGEGSLGNLTKPPY